MINKNELRFGNKVQPDKEHAAQFNNIRVWSVTQIYEGGFTVDYHWPGKWFEGIPLSPEILEACGFEPVRPTMMPGYAFYRSKSFDGRHRFRWESVEGFAMETVGSGWLWHFKDIKYLHQIQNFAYSITGTELTINLEKVKV